MTQIAVDWEDRLRLSAPFVEQRSQFQICQASLEPRKLSGQPFRRCTLR